MCATKCRRLPFPAIGVSSLSITAFIGSPLLLSSLQYYHRSSAETPPVQSSLAIRRTLWENRASRNLIINVSYVRFRRSGEFLARQREEGKNELRALRLACSFAATASKKETSDTLSPTSWCRARATRALFGSPRDKGRLIQGPTDMHAHTQPGPSYVGARGPFVRGASRVVLEDALWLEFLCPRYRFLNRAIVF